MLASRLHIFFVFNKLKRSKLLLLDYTVLRPQCCYCVLPWEIIGVSYIQCNCRQLCSQESYIYKGHLGFQADATALLGLNFWNQNIFSSVQIQFCKIQKWKNNLCCTRPLLAIKLEVSYLDTDILMGKWYTASLQPVAGAANRHPSHL